MTGRYPVLLALLVFACLSCGGKSRESPLDAGTDPGLAEDVLRDDGTMSGIDMSSEPGTDGLVAGLDGCLGGSPAVRSDKIDRAPPSLELSKPDEELACCNEQYCCERSEGLRTFRLDPAGQGGWQLLANVPICCEGPLSKVLVRIDGSGAVRWMRTTCYQQGTYLYGSTVLDAIPFAGGHLATYQVPGDNETSTYPVELRYFNAGGQILWTLPTEEIGNAKGLEPLRRTPGHHAKFIAGNGIDRFFLSVSSLGQADLKLLPKGFGGIMTDIPDVPEEEGFPLLLVDGESDALGFTKRITFRHLDAGGSISVTKPVGTWKGRFGVNGVGATLIGPGASGYLIVASDNSTHIWEVIRLDGKGERVWSYKGLIDSPNWNSGTRDFLHLLPDGRLLVIGNRSLNVPYWGFLSSDGNQLELQVKGELELPDAPASSWSLSSVVQLGSRWIVFAGLRVLIYDSEFNLVHTRNYYSGPGVELPFFARQGDTWGLAVTHLGSGLDCLNELHFEDAATSFLSFDGVCE